MNSFLAKMMVYVLLLCGWMSCSDNYDLQDLRPSNSQAPIESQKISGPTIVDLALATPDLSILVQALTRPDLSTDFVDLLNGPRSFTVIAPTNQAFVNLLGAVEEWNSLEDIPADVLESVLKYHVSPRPNGTSQKLAKGTPIPTLLSGQSWIAKPSGSTLQIEGNASTALVVNADIQADNGYIHIIDAVVLP